MSSLSLSLFLVNDLIYFYLHFFEASRANSKSPRDHIVVPLIGGVELRCNASTNKSETL